MVFIKSERDQKFFFDSCNVIAPSDGMNSVLGINALSPSLDVIFNNGLSDSLTPIGSPVVGYNSTELNDGVDTSSAPGMKYLPHHVTQSRWQNSNVNPYTHPNNLESSFRNFPLGKDYPSDKGFSNDSDQHIKHEPDSFPISLFAIDDEFDRDNSISSLTFLQHMQPQSTLGNFASSPDQYHMHHSSLEAHPDELKNYLAPFGLTVDSVANGHTTLVHEEIGKNTQFSLNEKGPEDLNYFAASSQRYSEGDLATSLQGLDLGSLNMIVPRKSNRHDNQFQFFSNSVVNNGVADSFQQSSHFATSNNNGNNDQCLGYIDSQDNSPDHSLSHVSPMSYYPSPAFGTSNNETNVHFHSNSNNDKFAKYDGVASRSTALAAAHTYPHTRTASPSLYSADHLLSPLFSESLGSTTHNTISHSEQAAKCDYANGLSLPLAHANMSDKACNIHHLQTWDFEANDEWLDQFGGMEMEGNAIHFDFDQAGSNSNPNANDTFGLPIRQRQNIRTAAHTSDSFNNQFLDMHSAPLHYYNSSTRQYCHEMPSNNIAPMNSNNIRYPMLGVNCNAPSGSAYNFSMDNFNSMPSSKSLGNYYTTRNGPNKTMYYMGPNDASMPPPTGFGSTANPPCYSLNINNTKHSSRVIMLYHVANYGMDHMQIRALFSHYANGPVRSMTAVDNSMLIGFFDLRHSQRAMSSLNGKVINGSQPLDMQYHFLRDASLIGKDNNQGTLVVFNLDSSIFNSELIQLFGKYGEIKEIRESPNKKHKFVEFYDVRCAGKAMKALNKTDLRGRKIKIEPSRPGGSNRMDRERRTTVSSASSFPNCNNFNAATNTQANVRNLPMNAHSGNTGAVVDNAIGKPSVNLPSHHHNQMQYLRNVSAMNDNINVNFLNGTTVVPIKADSYDPRSTHLLISTIPNHVSATSPLANTIPDSSSFGYPSGSWASTVLAGGNNAQAGAFHNNLASHNNPSMNAPSLSQFPTLDSSPNSNLMQAFPPGDVASPICSNNIPVIHDKLSRSSISEISSPPINSTVITGNVTSTSPSIYLFPTEIARNENGHSCHLDHISGLSTSSEPSSNHVDSADSSNSPPLNNSIPPDTLHYPTSNPLAPPSAIQSSLALPNADLHTNSGVSSLLVDHKDDTQSSLIPLGSSLNASLSSATSFSSPSTENSASTISDIAPSLSTITTNADSNIPVSPKSHRVISHHSPQTNYDSEDDTHIHASCNGTAISHPTSSTASNSQINSSSLNNHSATNVVISSESKFDIIISHVQSGRDPRTTLMIKNIPNKYDQDMLLLTVNKNNVDLYDFFYLPIDFKNKCNVGYAFINFIDPQDIPNFYREFNSKRWEKFNSEKVCRISYARIQGKIAMIDHFKNSSIMYEDPKCRPLIFYSDGSLMGKPEPFPIGPNVRPRKDGGSTNANSNSNYNSSNSNNSNTINGNFSSSSIGNSTAGRSYRPKIDKYSSYSPTNPSIMQPSGRTSA